MYFSGHNSQLGGSTNTQAPTFLMTGLKSFCWICVLVFQSFLLSSSNLELKCLPLINGGIAIPWRREEAPGWLGAGRRRLLPLLCQPQLSCLQSILRIGSGASKSQRDLLFPETKTFLWLFFLILKHLLSFHNEPSTIYKISNKMVLTLRVSFKSTVIIIF